MLQSGKRDMLQQLRAMKLRRGNLDSEGGKPDIISTVTAVDAELTESEVSCTSQGRAADEFLVILVHEARNLVAKDHDTHSSDPFVKVSLGSCSKKTRVIYRNCHPLWEQRLVFPVGGVSEEEPLLIELFDKDFRTKEFLGQVVMTLGKAREIAADPAMGEQYWLSVSKQRSADVVGGELCLGFQVIDAAMYATLLEGLDSQLDAEQITTSLADKALHVQLKGLNGLGASGLFRKSSTGTTPTRLSLYIKYGRLTMEKHLPLLATTADAGASACDCAGYELPVNEEVVIPLEAALGTVAARRRDELYDVKLYVKSTLNNTTIAKTQIPIWSIPFNDKRTTAEVPDGCSPANTATVANSPRPETPRSTQESAATSRLSSDKRAGVAAFAASVLYKGDVSEDSAASCCSTPRTTGGSSTGDFSLAAYRGEYPACPSPRMALFRAANQDDIMQRSKSDGAGLLFGRCPDNLPQLSGISTGATCSKSGFLEGSLCSVTSSKLQNPAGPAAFGRKKVQNLDDLHDMRTALKSKLSPGKEVTRVGWAPIKTQCDEAGVQACNSSCKPFYRTMEGCVPMYTNLEIGLGLELVPQVQHTEAAVTCKAGQQGDPTVDYSDDDECQDATPLTLPEPYDLILQDCTVQTGVNRLHQLLLSSKSKLMTEHYVSEGLKHVEAGPWQLGESGTECLRSRKVSYIKKLNIPVPLAPKQCQVWEEHRLLIKRDGGFVAQHVCTNNAPKGDCFRALIQICGVYVTSSSSRLRISMKLDWHKNTLGKSMVQIGAEADSKRGWGNLIQSLHQYVSKRASKGDRNCETSLAAAPEAAVTEDTASSNEESVASGISRWATSHLITLGWSVLLLTVLMMAILLVVSFSGLRNEVRQLKEAIQALADAATSTNNASCYFK